MNTTSLREEIGIRFGMPSNPVNHRAAGAKQASSSPLDLFKPEERAVLERSASLHLAGPSAVTAVKASRRFNQ